MVKESLRNKENKRNDNNKDVLVAEYACVFFPNENKYSVINFKKIQTFENGSKTVKMGNKNYPVVTMVTGDLKKCQASAVHMEKALQSCTEDEHDLAPLGKF